MERNYTLYSLLAIIPAALLFIFLSAMGEKGGFLFVAILCAILGVVVLFKFNRQFLTLALICLGLFPWTYGLDAGSFPKIFGDEVLFLVYFGYFALVYILLRHKRMSLGDPVTACLLMTAIIVQTIPFLFHDTDYIAIRNFLETYVFGLLLFIVFTNETDSKNQVLFTNAIIFTAVILSLGLMVEWIAEYNPFMEKTTDIVYLSPQLAEITGGVYRPYTTFFHPSEAGTFIAMCLPFVYRKAVDSRKIWSWPSVFLAIVLAAIMLNYTRGIWLAVGISTLIYVHKLRRHLLYLIPIAAIMFLIVILVFPDMPFVKRLTDPKNLYARFFYWGVAFDAFKENVVFGIGHMNFKNVYLDFVREISRNIQFNVRNVFVADSIYLTTMVEAGLLGISALLCFWGAVIIRLRRSREALRKIGRNAESAFLMVCLQSITIYLLAGLLADLHQFTKATKFVFIVLGMACSVIPILKKPERAFESDKPQ